MNEWEHTGTYCWLSWVVVQYTLQINLNFNRFNNADVDWLINLFENPVATHIKNFLHTSNVLYIPTVFSQEGSVCVLHSYQILWQMLPDLIDSRPTVYYSPQSVCYPILTSICSLFTSIYDAYISQGINRAKNERILNNRHLNIIQLYSQNT